MQGCGADTESVSSHWHENCLSFYVRFTCQYCCQSPACREYPAGIRADRPLIFTYGQDKEDIVISYETANTLLREFSLQEELEPLQLDEDSYCMLVSADEHVVHIRFDEAQGTFIVFGSIGTLSRDEEVARRELRALLTANLMWQDTMGATITLAPESDTVLLQQMWLPEQATVEKLGAFLQSFVLLISFWETRFASLGDELMESEQPFYIKV